MKMLLIEFEPWVLPADKLPPIEYNRAFFAPMVRGKEAFVLVVPTTNPVFFNEYMGWLCSLTLFKWTGDLFTFYEYISKFSERQLQGGDRTE